MAGLLVRYLLGVIEKKPKTTTNLRQDIFGQRYETQRC